MWLRRLTNDPVFFRWTAVVLAGTAFWLSTADMARGQAGGTTGGVQGIVSDTSGGVLPGVTVTASSPSELGQRAAVTNERGEYRFPALSPGMYKLQFELQGFTTIVREGLDVHVSATSTIDIEMPLAALQETVVVSGAAPVVDAVNTQFQQVVKQEKFETLTGSRDLWTIVQATPGMRMNAFDIGGTTAGTQQNTFNAYGRSNHMRVEEDGINTALSGVQNITGMYQDFGAADEVQITTAGADATMATPGALIRLVGKKGGNRFSGRELFYYQSTGMQARNIADQRRLEGFGDGVRIDLYRDANLDLGGPFIRDKFWFYTSVRDFKVDTRGGPWPVDNPGTGPERAIQLRNASYNLTYQPDPNNRLQHSFKYGHRSVPFDRPGAFTFQGSANVSNLYLDAAQHIEEPSWVGRAEWNRVVSNTFLYDVRMGRLSQLARTRPYGQNGQVDGDVFFRRVESAAGRGNPTAGGAFSQDSGQDRWVFDARATKYIDSWLGGNHQLMAGYIWERTEDLGELIGHRDNILVTYRSLPGQRDFTTPYRVTIFNTPLTQKDLLLQQGLFLQDRFELTPRVTLNLGVRYDRWSDGRAEASFDRSPYRDYFYAGRPLPNGYAVPPTPFSSTFTSPAVPRVVLWNSVYPRLGFSWAFGKRGTQAIKASWGLYKSSPGVSHSRGTGPAQQQTSTFNWIDRNGDGLFQQNEFGDWVDSTGTSNPNLQLQGYRGTLYSAETNVWYERELWGSFSGRVGFIRKQILDSWATYELNRPYSLYQFYPDAGYDPGPDGVRGTADDEGTFGYYDIPPGTILPPSIRGPRDDPEDDYDFPSLDFVLEKRMSHRWSGQFSYSATWRRWYLNLPHPSDPNDTFMNWLADRIWTFKAFTTIVAPWGFMVSPQLLMQNGLAYARYVTVNPRYTPSKNIIVEKYGSHQAPMTAFVNLQVRKGIAIGRQRLTFIFEGQNLSNENTATGERNVTGIQLGARLPDGSQYRYPSFGSATDLMPPRAFRFGVQFDFGMNP